MLNFIGSLSSTKPFQTKENHSQKQNIPRARSDTFIFKLNLTDIEMNILQPTHNELISGGDVLINVDVRGIHDKDKGNFMFAIGWNNATETRIHNDSLSNIIVTNLPSSPKSWSMQKPDWMEDISGLSSRDFFLFYETIIKTTEKRLQERG